MKGSLSILIFGMVLISGISVAATLTGVVVDAANSTPIAGASVSVDVLIPDSISFTTLTNVSGMYGLFDIPGGNAIYVIRCYVPGFADFYMRYDALSNGDRQVDILMYPQAPRPPGDAGRDSADVSGIVLYESPSGERNPVDKATVTLTSHGDQYSAETGPNGKYSMRLRKASYALNVEAPLYETLTAGGVTVDSAGLVLNILLKSSVVSVPDGIDVRPESITLYDAFPNPFNPTTAISYQLSAVSDVKLSVFDILGREVAELVNERKAPGSYDVTFDGSSLASGVYFYRLYAGDFVQSRKLLLLK